ncbi:MAG: mobilization protein [Pseudomonadota bacterium]|nr:mobilization protein [Pseudomonadota bacterium]
MSSLNFIGGEKGGVGKSVLSRLLAQYFIDKGIAFTGFDTDRSHTSFARFYADYASPVVVDSFEGLDEVVSEFEHLDPGHVGAHALTGDLAPLNPAARPVPRVIVDLAAQTAAPLARWIHESNLLEVMRELGVKVNFWHVADAGQDTIDLLDRLLSSYGEGAQVIVVKNYGRGSDFSALEASAPMRRALAQNARVIALGGLNEASMGKIDRQNASFWGAVHQRGPNSLGMLDRQRVRSWLNTSYTALDSLSL